MAKKVQQTTEATVTTRVRPLWTATNNIITLVNEESLTTEQMKYLKAFVGKTSSSDRIEKLKAAILMNEGEITKKPAPKKEQPEKLSKEQVKEATKSAKEEVAPTTETKDNKKVVTKKGKGDKKSAVKSEKPKAQPKRNPLRGSKTTDMYDSDTIYEEGQLVEFDGLFFKVMGEDAKPKVGQWAFVPKFEGADGRDCFMRIMYIGKATVWLLEPFYSENTIPIGPEALAVHYLDEVDDKGDVIPEEEWIPFYLVEMTTAPKKEEPKEEVKEEKEEPKTEPEKTEEKPKKTKTTAKKPKVKKNKTA